VLYVAWGPIALLGLETFRYHSLLQADHPEYIWNSYTVLLSTVSWTANKKNKKLDIIHQQLPSQRLLTGMMTLLTLILSTWEEMEGANRLTLIWCWSRLSDFLCLTDRNPAATALPLHSSHISTWSWSINQFGALCLFLCLENVLANV